MISFTVCDKKGLCTIYVFIVPPLSFMKAWAASTNASSKNTVKQVLNE